ncbi:MAG: hypothetical protein Q9200_004189 [Gallowayella weberi]
MAKAPAGRFLDCWLVERVDKFVQDVRVAAVGGMSSFPPAMPGSRYMSHSFWGMMKGEGGADGDGEQSRREVILGPLRVVVDIVGVESLGINLMATAGGSGYKGGLKKWL